LLLRHDLGDRGGNIGVRLEENLDDRDAVQRLRLDVLDVVDQSGQTALVLRGDAVAHFLGGQPSVVPDDADHRNIDFRKDVRGHPQKNQWRRKEDQQRHDQERIRPPQRNLNDPH